MPSGKKLTLADAHLLAEENSGKCLSTEYINNNTVMQWECMHGHKFNLRYREVQQGHWCKHCAGNIQIQDEIQDMIEFCGGKLIRGKVRHSRSPVIVEGECGHQWQTNSLRLNRGQWCPVCAPTAKKTITDMQKYAKSRGGKCISAEYRGNREKLEWQCSKGHTWQSTPDIVRTGKWCPHCAKVVRLNIELMQKIAEERGGKCLSREYINATTKLEWQCARGHIWKAKPDKVKNQGTWCRECWIEDMRGNKISSK